MDRRTFVKNSLLTCGSLGWQRGLASSLSAATTKNAGPARFKVDYIRESIPAFEIPPYPGQSYQDKVPDTLDLAERARLGVHALTSIADPEADYEVYWTADFFRKPAVMTHDFNDWVLQCEGLLEALPLLRNVTGETQDGQVDRAWMTMLLKSIGPDGLAYVPMKGRPWGRYNYQEIDPVWRANGTKTKLSDESVVQVTTAEFCGGILGAMALYYQRDKNPMWKAASQRMLQRLTSLATNKDNYSYLSDAWEPNAKIGPDAEMPSGFIAAEWSLRLIQGCTQYCRVTGYEPAQAFAVKLTNFLRDHSQYYDSQGRFLPEGPVVKPWLGKYYAEGLQVGGHGQWHTFGLLAMLEHATLANDRETQQFVRAGYEWARTQGPSFGVSSLVGWFPEWFVPNYPSSETCPVAEMIAMGVKMSAAGIGDYWDDVDRWVRNHYAEAQLTSVDWVYRMAERQPGKPVQPNEKAEHMPERNLGSWAGWASGNDWTIWRAGIMHCCTGNGTRVLYYLWENMLEHKDDQLRVNLLLNRASRWADVHSHIPCQGLVELRIKTPLQRVLLRAPEWVAGGSEAISCRVNNSPRPLHWEDRYLDLGAVKPSDHVALAFPIPQRTVRERIGPETYSLVVKGNTVISIDPPGRNGPLYQDRAQYSQNQVQWRTVKRFVPDEIVEW